MANEEHLKILKQGVEVWNQWREENPDIRPGLHGANLRGAGLGEANLRGADLGEAELFGANLHGANLRGADLSAANLSAANLSAANLNGAGLIRANLRGANLIRANLGGADLSGADLSVASLSEANLIRANLGGADLSEAGLIAANLFGANLRGVNLRGAEAGFTSFTDLDLSVAKGLDSVRHAGPSYIDIHTLYRSEGKIPEAFLRGAGVPDTFITYIASLTGEAIQYYSCFISYSHDDEAFAQRLHNDLQGKGVRCWFAPEDIRAGEKLFEQIDQAIRYHDKLLLVLSENSIHSEWVMTEIRRARKAEAKDRRRKLFPVRLVDWGAIKAWECFDADAGKDLAVEVREYFIPDFSHWKDHDAYQQGFDRLLRDLKAEEG